MARVNPYNPDSPALLAGEQLILVPKGRGDERSFRVLGRRKYKRLVLVTLAGINSLTELEPWIGSEVQIPAETLPSGGNDGLYHWEAIGLEVRTTDGIVVGRIDEVMTLPANDLWVVRAAGRETLVPVVNAIVLEVDLVAGTATIDPPAGLIPED
jgi:16S rRNA processing protein RimM